MEIDKQSIKNLARQLSPSSKAFTELTKRGILRTKNVVGELGEYYAIDFYNNNTKLPNLSIVPTTVKNIDALSREGKTYSIKTISKKGSTGSFWDPESIDRNERKFDFLLIVILDREYSLDMILELTWEDFLHHKKFNKRMKNYSVSVSNKLIDLVRVIYNKG